MPSQTVCHSADFSFQSILPAESVLFFTDSTGNILWKEKSAEWHTVWEGRKKFGYDGQESNLVLATVPYSESIKIRVTFSDLYAYYGSSGRSEYTPNNKQSPVTYDSFKSGINLLVRAYAHSYNDGGEYESFLRYNTTTGKIDGGGIKKGYYPIARSYIVITKIEVYS